MPIAPYLLYRTQDNAACDSFFCKNNSGPYTVPVADEFYLAENYIDTIWKKVDKTNYRGPRRYRYSDVNFMLVQRIVESHLEEGMDDFLNKEFYYPLGLRRNMYNPLDAYAKEAIIPTQNDYRWRHQQVHGYVHDEAAALFGGVGGNAGLFSTAEDLAVIFQMLLNNGHYGGKQYLDETTVKLFTNTYHGNHRGLGFDKPTSGSRSAYSRSASPETFGHTGFTGTCVWADPKHDLIFVFLSNRIYPNVNNRALFKEQVRERIHEVVYDALDTYKVSFPVLDFKPGQKS
jgi:CubicO group peptidase (beta-lactamase class C family)